MKSAFPLRRLALATGLAFAAPALFAQTLAQTPAPAAKPAVAAPAAVKPAAPTPAAAKPATAPATPAPAVAGPAGAVTGTPPVDPNAPAVPPVPPPPPLSDIILTNGDVITLDDKRPSAQAVAIKGSKIVAVGKSKDILARWKSEGTEVVDLAGKTLVPGFIDAWGQMSRLGLDSVAAQLQSPPEGPVSDVNGLIRALREWGKGELATRFGWILGFGYDDSRLREQRPLSRNDLDAVSRDKPVLVIHQSGRQAVANGKALELAGINRDSI
ncbi:amidohydrolase family protein, partial [Zoogloea sp.]|uniref:amidohydrolase family protein n=1 Tax=Zoogloea sp. TaxID=49181 RepID=UPI002B9B1795